MSDFQSTGGTSPVGESLRRFASSFLEFLTLRWKLIGLESKEALGVYLRALIYFLIAALLLIFGYLLLLLAFVFLIATWTDWHWAWITLGVGVLHALAATILVILARSLLHNPCFPHTTQILKEDSEWLRSTSKLKNPNS